jgi:hypothetical protein
MSNPKHNSYADTHKDLKNWFLHPVKSKADLGKPENMVDGYVPMDVYVDPRTMKEQFNASSVRSRGIKIH